MNYIFNKFLILLPKLNEIYPMFRDLLFPYVKHVTYRKLTRFDPDNMFDLKMISTVIRRNSKTCFSMSSYPNIT